MSVVVHPPPNDGIEVPDDLPCRCLLVALEVRLDAPQVHGHLVLGGTDEQLPVEATNVEAKEVEPVIHMDDAGLRFTQLQTAGCQELCDLGDHVFLKDLLGGCGHHEVVRVTDDVQATIETFPTGGGHVLPPRVFRAEQPFQTIERNVRQERRDDAALRCS